MLKEKYCKNCKWYDIYKSHYHDCFVKLNKKDYHGDYKIEGGYTNKFHFFKRVDRQLDRNVNVFKIKKKWQKFIPTFILKLFINPIIFKDCEIKSMGKMEIDNSGTVTIPIKFEYKEE